MAKITASQIPPGGGTSPLGFIRNRMTQINMKKKLAAKKATKATAKKATKKAAEKTAASQAVHADVTSHPGSGSNNSHPKPDIKKFIPSPNHSSRNGASIDMIVLHCTEASLQSTVSTFQDGSPNGRQVSAHYVIDNNGDIYQMVNDNERANHCKGANRNSIGIEHVASENDPLTSQQSDASASLVRWLAEQYDIPPHHIYGHDFAPGYSGGGTSCPDALFGAHSQAAVQAWVNANVADSLPLGSPFFATTGKLLADSFSLAAAPVKNRTHILLSVCRKLDALLIFEPKLFDKNGNLRADAESVNAGEGYKAIHEQDKNKKPSIQRLWIFINKLREEFGPFPLTPTQLADGENALIGDLVALIYDA